MSDPEFEGCVRRQIRKYDQSVPLVLSLGSSIKKIKNGAILDNFAKLRTMSSDGKSDYTFP